MVSKKSRRVLRPRSRHPLTPKIPESLKQRVQAEADALVRQVLKPRSVRPPPPEPRFNYIIDVYTHWWRNSLYFCAMYACPGPNALAPTFEVRFARLEYAGRERFHLAFMRHTGQWIELYESVPLDEALTAVRDDPFFQLG